MKFLTLLLLLSITFSAMGEESVACNILDTGNVNINKALEKKGFKFSSTADVQVNSNLNEAITITNVTKKMFSKVYTYKVSFHIRYRKPLYKANFEAQLSKTISSLGEFNKEEAFIDFVKTQVPPCNEINLFPEWSKHYKCNHDAQFVFDKTEKFLYAKIGHMLSDFVRAENDSQFLDHRTFSIPTWPENAMFVPLELTENIVLKQPHENDTFTEFECSLQKNK
jgi:hypothetical protein